jgi:hypothetical protein
MVRKLRFAACIKWQSGIRGSVANQIQFVLVWVQKEDASLFQVGNSEIRHQVDLYSGVGHVLKPDCEERACSQSAGQ